MAKDTFLVLKPLKTNRICVILGLNPYRAVNTLSVIKTSQFKDET